MPIRPEFLGEQQKFPTEGHPNFMAQFRAINRINAGVNKIALQKFLRFANKVPEDGHSSQDHPTADTEKTPRPAEPHL